jgi:hypothetical protein
MTLINSAADGTDMRGGVGFLVEEGGPWGKHGFPHEASPKDEAK